MLLVSRNILKTGPLSKSNQATEGRNRPLPLLVGMLEGFYLAVFLP
jgi:hypothetical protein